jgi:hypothetical protein
MLPLSLFQQEGPSQAFDMSPMVAAEPMQRGIGQIGPYGMGMGGFNPYQRAPQQGFDLYLMQQQMGGGFNPYQQMGGGFNPYQQMGGGFNPYQQMGGGFNPYQQMGGGFNPYQQMGGGFNPYQQMGGGFDPYQQMGGGFNPYQQMGGGFNPYQQMGGGFNPYQQMGGGFDPYQQMGGGFNPSIAGMGNFSPFAAAPSRNPFASIRQNLGPQSAMVEIPSPDRQRFLNAYSTPAQPRQPMPAQQQPSMDMAYRGPSRTPEQQMVADQTRRMVEQQRAGMQQQALNMAQQQQPMPAMSATQGEMAAPAPFQSTQQYTPQPIQPAMSSRLSMGPTPPSSSAQSMGTGMGPPAPARQTTGRLF